MSGDTEKTTDGDIAKEEIAKERSLVLQQLEHDYSLPWERARELIRSESPLTQVGVEMVLNAARVFRLPLQGINVIPGRSGALNIFVNSDGVRWRLHTDPRGIKRSEGKVLHLPLPEEPYIHAEGVIEFKDGSTFINSAVMYFKHVNGAWLERSRKGEWNEVSLGDRVMAAITKSKRRAGVDAVGVGLPIFEDWVGDVGEPTEEKGGVTVIPGNLSALLQDISRRGVPVADVIAKLGVDSIEKLADDLTGAWQAAIELQKQKNGS